MRLKIDAPINRRGNESALFFYAAWETDAKRGCIRMVPEADEGSCFSTKEAT